MTYGIHSQWRIEYPNVVQKEIQNLDPPARKAVHAAMVELAGMENPLAHPCVEKLRMNAQWYRYKLTKYNLRIIFRPVDTDHYLETIQVAPRSAAYGGKLRDRLNSFNPSRHK